MSWLCLWTWEVVSHEAWTMGEVRRSRRGCRMVVDFHHKAKLLPWGQAQGHSERALKGPRWALLIFWYCWHHRAQAGRWCSAVGTNNRAHILPRNWKISIFPASWDILKTFFSLQWPGLIIPFAGLCTNIYASNCKILCVCVSHSVVSNSVTPWTVAHQASLSMEFFSKNTGVCCHSLLQGIFPTQGLNLGLSYCRHILYCRSPQGSPSQTPTPPAPGLGHSFEDISPLCLHLPGKALKLFFPASPKTLSLRFNSVLGYRGQIWLQFQHCCYPREALSQKRIPHSSSSACL